MTSTQNCTFSRPKTSFKDPTTYPYIYIYICIYTYICISVQTILDRATRPLEVGALGGGGEGISLSERRVHEPSEFISCKRCSFGAGRSHKPFQHLAACFEQGPISTQMRMGHWKTLQYPRVSYVGFTHSAQCTWMKS